MKVSASLLLLVAVVLAVVSNSIAWSRFPPIDEEEARDQKCERAFPRLFSRVFGRRCRYLCKGWPFRYETEEDGSPCRKLLRYEGYCLNGACVPGVYSTTPEPVTTIKHKEEPVTTIKPEEEPVTTINPEEESTPTSDSSSSVATDDSTTEQQPEPDTEASPSA